MIKIVKESVIKLFINSFNEVFNFGKSYNGIIENLKNLYKIEENHDENYYTNNYNITNFFNIVNDALNYSLFGKCISNQSEDEYAEDYLIMEIEKRIKELEMEEKNITDEWEYRLKQIIELGPKEDFSYYYKLLFFICLLYFLMDLTKNNENYFLNKSKDLNEIKNLFKPYYFSDKLILYLKRLCELVIDGDKESFDKLNISHFICENYIEKNFADLCLKEETNEYDLKLSILTLKFCVFLDIVTNNTLDKKVLWNNYVEIAMLSMANRYYQIDKHFDCFDISKIALKCNDSERRQDAFNLLGICAINSNQYQLAYDIYFSWINRRFIFDMQIDMQNEDKIIIDDLLKSKKEFKWRNCEKSKNYISIMYGNFSYVCSSMYDLLENSNQKKQLLQLAKHYIKKAIDLNPNIDNLYCTASAIFEDAKEYNISQKYGRRYLEKLNNDELDRKLYILRRLIIIYVNLVINNKKDELYYNEFCQLEKEYFNLYKLALKIDNPNNELKKEITNGENLFSFIEETKELKKEIKCFLYEFNNNATLILNNLRQIRYKEYVFDLHIQLFLKEEDQNCKLINNTNCKVTKINVNEINIAYYTTLENLKFLFQNSKNIDITGKGNVSGNNGNYLTMMHACYMNDPEEGLKLLQKLKEYLPNDPETLRNELFDQKFVFLKSFTSLVDQLNMWTLYGSNKNNGEDCNGCCICLASETFEMALNRAKSDKNSNFQLGKYENDDYHLYRVAYIDKEQIYLDGDENNELTNFYRSLKKTLSKISKYSKHLNINDKDKVYRCVIRSLEKLIFLFKDISYYQENEMRLIITRNINEKSEVLLTSSNPPKLYINPIFQVFPEKIILGPKIKNPDVYIPYLQYELLKISEKWPSSLERKFKPVVRKSEINIR